MNYNILFLDDNEKRISHFEKNTAARWKDDNDYHIVRTAQEAILALQTKESWDTVHLDHDLGGEVFQNSGREDCGMEVVRYIIENKIKIECIVIHSWNFPAGEVMQNKLEDAGYEVIKQPYAV